jgi:hypothetical protein
MTFDFFARAVPHSKQNDFRRSTQEDTTFFEVRVFGNYGEAICLGIFPDRRIVRITKPKGMNAGREIFVEKKLHAFSISSLRSRSAAKARQARISSSVK